MGVTGAVVGGVAAVALGLPVLLTGLVASTAASTAGPSWPVVLGAGVPARYQDDILAAASACPRISPSILAAQLQVGSDWDPDAVSAEGARGLAQFLPGTWALWGGDLDEDGTNSPLDPGDAIRAQAGYLCHLLDATQHVASGDRVAAISVALAAYHVGEQTVLDHGGIPPSAKVEAYVARVWATATRPDFALTLAGDAREDSSEDVPGGGVDAMLPGGYRNGRTAAQAVAYALGQVGVWRDAGYCLRFIARNVYQRPTSGGNIPSAYQVWANAPTSLHHPRDFTPPRGAIVLWGPSIGGGHGHIALSLGNGQMITTTRGAVAITTIHGFADHAYLGWMPPYFKG